jgi:hypothetical protein
MFVCGKYLTLTFTSNHDPSKVIDRTIDNALLSGKVRAAHVDKQAVD